MSSEQLKMKNDQAALRFQYLVQTENLQVVVWFLLLLPGLFQFVTLLYLLKGKIHPKFQMSVFTFLNK